MSNFSSKALELILQAEGLDQPGKWPGGASGITIGIGYDLGYVTVDQFESDWHEFLTAAQIERLRKVIGMRGVKAQNRAGLFPDIRIKRADADRVFTERTLPLHQLRTQQAFPGIENLPLDAQGALVSLCFNRGTSMVGERRSEMRAIRDAVPSGNLQEIADQLRAMKRLWIGKKLDGLLKRREAEALLVESCIA